MRKRDIFRIAFGCGLLVLAVVIFAAGLSCGERDEGHEVWVWGDNSFGKLGIGVYTKTESEPTPVRLRVPGRVKDISWSMAHGLIVTEDGEVYGMGGGYGNRPVRLKALDGQNVVAVAAGSEHSLALKADGTVLAWGYNREGQLGNPSVGRLSKSPVPVKGLADVKAVHAECDTSMAIKEDGSVWAWGSFEYPRDKGYDGRRPVKVEGLEQIIALLGYWHSLKADGTVLELAEVCTGRPGAWVLADVRAGQVRGPTKVTAIGNGPGGWYAFAKDGAVWTWQRAMPGSVRKCTPPALVKMPELSDIVAVASGDFYSVLLKSDGTVWAWGDNGAGQLGDGTREDKDKPFQVNGLTGVTRIYAGGDSSAAIVSRKR